ncbi:3-phosphoshikimate 1-carboxyvinyltransferase [Verrucomicrobiota bacterium]
MTIDDSKIIRPFSSELCGTVRVPGDKSISHRAVMLSAVASGESLIDNFLLSEDCLDTLHAVESLGVSVSREDVRVRVKGLGGKLSASGRQLDLGNSGTGMRLLAGLLAGQKFSCEMMGDASLLSRPMRRIKEPLELMGAKVELLGSRECAPMRITGADLEGIEYKLPVASAQVKSCVLLAGLFAEGQTTIVEPAPSRDHTERMLRAMNADIEVDGPTIRLKGSGGNPLSLKAEEWIIPGDFSSAAFWITAAACREGSEIIVENVGLNPRRIAFLGVLERMGADIEAIADCGLRNAEWEPVGNITVKGRKLKGTEIGGEEIPNLIDELPLVAVAGILAEGKTVIRDAAELRVKESDRIATMAAGLSALGVKVEETPDGMIIEGGQEIAGDAQVDSCGDHRIAMALAVLALFAVGPVRIMRTDCVATSYPGFWEEMKKMMNGSQRAEN